MINKMFLDSMFNFPIEIKIKMLKSMNDIILEKVGDDNVSEIWFIEGIPDEPSEDDYHFIAADRGSFEEVVNLFTELIQENPIS